MQCDPTPPTDPLKPIAASRTKSLPCSLHRGEVRVYMRKATHLAWDWVHKCCYNVTAISTWISISIPSSLPYHHDHHYIDYIHCCAIPFQLYLNVQPLDRPSGQRLRKAQISGRWALAFFRTKSAASSEKQVGSSKMDNEWVVSTVLVFSCIYWFLHLFNSISVSCLPIYLSVHSTDLLVCLSIYLIIYCISMRFWCIHQFICLNIHFWHRFVDRERERRGENRISYVKMPSSVSARSDRQTHLVEDLPCKMLHTKEATGKSWVDLRLRDQHTGNR